MPRLSEGCEKIKLAGTVLAIIRAELALATSCPSIHTVVGYLILNWRVHLVVHSEKLLLVAITSGGFPRARIRDTAANCELLAVPIQASDQS